MGLMFAVHSGYIPPLHILPPLPLQPAPVAAPAPLQRYRYKLGFESSPLPLFPVPPLAHAHVRIGYSAVAYSVAHSYTPQSLGLGSGVEREGSNPIAEASAAALVAGQV